MDTITIVPLDELLIPLSVPTTLTTRVSHCTASPLPHSPSAMNVSGSHFLLLNINRGHMNLKHWKQLLAIVRTVVVKGGAVVLVECPLTRQALAENVSQAEYPAILRIYQSLLSHTAPEVNTVCTTPAKEGVTSAITGICVFLPTQNYAVLPFEARTREVENPTFGLRCTPPVFYTGPSGPVVLMSHHLPLCLDRKEGSMARDARVYSPIRWLIHNMGKNPEVYCLPENVQIVSLGDFNNGVSTMTHLAKRFNDKFLSELPEGSSPRGMRMVMSEGHEVPTCGRYAIDNCLHMGPPGAQFRVHSGLSGRGGTDHCAFAVRLPRLPT